MNADTSVSHLSLQIQLAATAIATSLILIFVPNVETISFTAFLVGFLFPFQFAVVTILTMTVTWELLASMIFAFSGFTFPFKLLAWLLIGMLGVFARRIKAKYFYEFLIFGAISAILFDLIVTIPSAFLFVQDQTAFLTVLISNLIIGLVFTISHTLSNAFLFAVIPFMMKTLLPLLDDNYPELVQISQDQFTYLNSITTEQRSWDIMFLDKKRLISYTVVLLLIILLIGSGLYLSISNHQPQTDGDRQITLSISYGGLMPTDNYTLQLHTKKTTFQILNDVAVINYTIQSGGEPYVLAINNVWEGQNRTGYFWLYFINGNFANLGANSSYPVDGDTILWAYRH